MIFFFRGNMCDFLHARKFHRRISKNRNPNFKSTFNNPNILRLESYWLVQNLDEDITRIVTKTPFCSGGNLENYIWAMKDDNGSNNILSLTYAYQLWEAIQYLHKLNFIHKDIKER